MTELRVVNGRPVPLVTRIFEGTPVAGGEPWQWEWRPRWEVEFPTEYQVFDTWPEALKYALDRPRGFR